MKIKEAWWAVGQLEAGRGVREVAEEAGTRAGLVSALAVVSGKGLDKVKLGPDAVRARRKVARLVGARLVKPDSELVADLKLGKSSLADLGLAWRLVGRGKGRKRSGAGLSGPVVDS